MIAHCILLSCNPALKIQFWISIYLFYHSWLEEGPGWHLFVTTHGVISSQEPEAALVSYTQN